MYSFLLMIHTVFFAILLDDSYGYGDGAGNTVEENSSVFSLIKMC